jgi:hypothetical protein
MPRADERDNFLDSLKMLEKERFNGLSCRRLFHAELNPTGENSGVQWRLKFSPLSSLQASCTKLDDAPQTPPYILSQ